MKGVHPDIPEGRKSESRIERSTLALTLLLRDRFAPLCQDLASQIKGMDDSEIRRIHPPGAVGELRYSIAPSVDLAALGNPDTGRYTKYYAPLQRPRGGLPTGIIHMTPVGAYGPEFTMHLLETTRKMLEITSEVSREGARQLYVEERELICRETSLSNPFSTLQDGIVSIANGFSLLMAERVPGFEKPFHAMVTIQEASLLNQLSLITPFGLIGPFMASGLYVKGLVVSNGNGRLRLNTEFVRAMHEARRSRKEHRKPLNWMEDASGIDLGHGCPVGRKRSGEDETAIHSLTEAFLHVFRAVQGLRQNNPLGNQSLPGGL